MQVNDKIRRLLERLDSGLVEREVHARLAFLALLSGHHVLLLGPPGTAKSLLARALCRCVSGAAYFEYLLTKFTHPDELFGPVSIPGLKEEDYRRLTEGYLPRAHVAFLDEIFKANSAILNSLLTLVNERVFHHGKHRDEVPLLGLVGASNEPPDSDGVLDALHDRFLVRVAVPAIAGEEGFLRVCLGEIDLADIPADERLTLGDIAGLRQAAHGVRAGDEVRRTIVAIRRKLASEGIAASDRRWRWALELVKMAAETSGRREIALVDLLLLEHCFGNPGESERIVRTIVREEMRAGVAIHGYRESLAARWQAMTAAPPIAKAENPTQKSEAYASSQSARMGELDSFDSEHAAASRALDAQLSRVTGEAGSSPWTAEVPPELVAGFVSARRLLNRFARASTGYRIELTDRPIERLLRQLRAEKRDRNNWTYYQGAQAVLWIGEDSGTSAAWVPVDEDGHSLSEDHHDCVERARYWARKFAGGRDGELAWEVLAYFVPLADSDLFALADEVRARRPGRAQRPALAELVQGHVTRAARRRAHALAEGSVAGVIPLPADQDRVTGALTALFERIDAAALCIVPGAPLVDDAPAPGSSSATGELGAEESA